MLQQQKRKQHKLFKPKWEKNKVREISDKMNEEKQKENKNIRSKNNNK